MFDLDVEIAHIRRLGEREHNVHWDLKAQINKKQDMKLHIGESLKAYAELILRFGTAKIATHCYKHFDCYKIS